MGFYNVDDAIDDMLHVSLSEYLCTKIGDLILNARRHEIMGFAVEANMSQLIAKASLLNFFFSKSASELPSEYAS